jgi:hypothetical protein
MPRRVKLAEPTSAMTDRGPAITIHLACKSRLSAAIPAGISSSDASRRAATIRPDFTGKPISRRWRTSEKGKRGSAWSPGESARAIISILHSFNVAPFAVRDSAIASKGVRPELASVWGQNGEQMCHSSIRSPAGHASTSCCHRGVAPPPKTTLTLEWLVSFEPEVNSSARAAARIKVARSRGSVSSFKMESQSATARVRMAPGMVPFSWKSNAMAISL